MRLYLVQRAEAAAALARCLPGMTKARGYYRGPDALVVALGGPLLQLAAPPVYDARYDHWALADLPILPDAPQTVPIPNAEPRLTFLGSLLAQADDVVHAGDPDREGQLAVDDVLAYLGNTLPVQRLLLPDLTPHALVAALGRLQPNAAFERLRRGAELRRWCDWLLGTNLTRAVTLMARRAGHGGVLKVGRVKAVILGLVVRRERERRAWQPRPVHRLTVQLANSQTHFTADWRSGAGREADAGAVGRVHARTRTARGTVTACDAQDHRQAPPPPLSLTALQALAGRAYGYAPGVVLKAADGLYLGGLISWPRTEHRHLPERSRREAPAVLAAVAENLPELAEAVAQADPVRSTPIYEDNPWTVHHGITPTTTRAPLASLRTLQRQLYDLICRVFIAQFYPDATGQRVRLEVAVAGELFEAHGYTPERAGWQSLFAAHSETALAAVANTDPAADPLPPLPVGTSLDLHGATVTRDETQPPPRYTLRSLIDALAAPDQHVTAPELRTALSEAHGVGTDTTQARIIEQLTGDGLLVADDAGALVPSDTAETLHDALPGLITRPDLSAAWAVVWQAVERGGGDATAFLTHAQNAVRLAVEHVRRQRFPPASGTVACPRCGDGILVLRNSPKRGPFWGCSTYPTCKALYDDHDGTPRLASRASRGRAGRRGISHTI